MHCSMDYFVRIGVRSEKMAQADPFMMSGVTVRLADGTLLLQIDGLTLKPGEWVHIAGPNGSGKSTLAKLIAGVPETAGGGQAAIGGTIDRGFAGERPLPFVQQDAEASIAGSTPWEDLALAFEARGVGGGAARAGVERLLRLCGLWDMRDLPVERLSGGQKQLLAAAGCAASGAPLILFDEAASMLDRAGRALVLEGARSLRAAGAAIVWISHETADIARGDRIVGLLGGRIVYDGGAEAFFRPDGSGALSPCERIGCEAPHAVRTALALSRRGIRLDPLPLTPEELTAQLEAFRREVGTDGAERPEAGEKLNPDDGCQCVEETAAAASDADNAPAEDWRIDGLTFTAGGLLRDAAAVFRGGRITAVVGPNGAGKTTLLETMAGLRRPASGTVSLGGEPLWRGRRPRREVLLQFGLAMQRSEAAWFADTVRDELAFAMRPYGVPPRERAVRTEAALVRAGLAAADAARSPWTLSGGEQRRLSWACLTAADAPWLLLDEPTAGLDAGGAAVLRDLLASHRAAGGGAVVVTHDLDALWPLIDDVVVVSAGMIREAAPAADWAQAVLAGGSVMPPEALPQALRTAAVLRASGFAVPEAPEPPERLAARIAAQLPPAAAPEPAQSAGDAARSAAAEPPAASAPPAADAAHPAEKAMPGSAASVHPWAVRDPRALWAAYLLTAAGVLAMDGPADTAAGLAAALLLVLPAARMLRPYRGLIVSYLVLTAAMTVFTGIRFAPAVHMDAEAALRTMLLMMRLLGAMLLGMPLLGLITPYRLQQAVDRLLLAIRLPVRKVQDVSLAVSLLFRFIPLMAGEWIRFARIGVARGKYPVPPGRIPFRLLPVVLIPFLLAMLQTAERLAVTLTLRGFAGGSWAAERARPIAFTWRDGLFTAGAAAVFALLRLIDLHV